MTHNPMLVVEQTVFDTVVKNVVAFLNVRIGTYDYHKRVSIESPHFYIWWYHFNLLVEHPRRMIHHYIYSWLSEIHYVRSGKLNYKSVSGYRNTEEYAMFILKAAILNISFHK